MKAALVTGAGSGIGHGICEALAADGWGVVLNDLDGDLAARAARAIDPERVIAVGGDVADGATAQAAVAACLERFGRIDAAIANAGITMFRPFGEATAEDLQRVLSVNLGGTWATVKAAVEAMERDAGARIVLMSSVAGLRAIPGLAAYGMSKAALMSFARSLALELSPLGICVSAIAPGATLTERTAHELPDYAGAWGKVLPARAVADAGDIAAAVRFLLSPAGSHLNGQTLVVDGGWTAIAPMPPGY